MIVDKGLIIVFSFNLSHCKRSVNQQNTDISNVFDMVKTKMNKRVQVMVSKAKMQMKTEI